MPVLAAEIDAMSRPELQLGVAGYIRYWPKLRGVNIAATSCSYTLFTPAGVTISGPTSFTPDTVDGISRFSIAITPSGGLWALAEDYRIAFTFTGTADGISQTITDSVGFDVVSTPLLDLGLSLNNMAADDNAAPMICERHAQTVDPGRSGFDQAQVYILEGVSEVRKMLKRKILERDGEWPTFIANREELRSVGVAAALHRMYRAQGFSSEAAVNAAEAWRNERDQRFADLPELRFSTSSTLVPNDSIRNLRSITLRRGDG